METRQLKYFLDVANCLNFTKAAQQNHIAQTAMSQNIISLENQLGFKLFDRNNRNVSLTYMGEAFYTEALEIIRAVERAEVRMSGIAAGSEGIVRIGFQGEHESSFLPQIIQTFRRRCPKVSLELMQGISGRLEQMLESGEVDVIFNIQYEKTADNAREWLIETQPLCAVVPEGHPLAGLERVSRTQLSGEPAVFINPACGENIYNYMIHDSLQSGFMPKIVGYASSVYALLLMVACSLGITVLPKSCSQGQAGLRFLDLEEEDSLNIVARWIGSNDRAPVRLFVQLLRELFPGGAQEN